MNGEARAYVMKIINKPKATQHEKLDAIIVLMLSDHERLLTMEAFVDSHPLSRIGAKLRYAVYGFVFVWFWGVTWAFWDFIQEVLRKAGLM